MLAYPVKSGVIGSDTVGQGVFYTLGALACLCLVALIAVACVMRAPPMWKRPGQSCRPKKPRNGLDKTPVRDILKRPVVPAIINIREG